MKDITVKVSDKTDRHLRSVAHRRGVSVEDLAATMLSNAARIAASFPPREEKKKIHHHQAVHT